jgi:hypothetical protein
LRRMWETMATRFPGAYQNRGVHNRRRILVNLFSKLYFGRSSRKSIDERIQEIQRESIKQLTKKLGLDYQDQIVQMLDNINKQHQDPSSPRGFRVDDDDLPFPLTTEQDFWRFRQKEALDMSRYAGELAERALEKGHLKPFSLKHKLLADRLSEALRKRVDSNSISAVIQVIPVLHLAEPEFNAVASTDYDLLGCPYVRHYYTTMRTLQILANVLVSNTMVFVPDLNGIMLKEPKSEYFYDRLTSDTPVLTTIATILYCLEKKEGAFPTGALPAYSLSATKDEWPVKRIGATVSTGAKMMLWLHEIGHHILDHFDSKSPQLTQETEADVFAISCLLAAGEDRPKYHLIGAEIPFLLLPTCSVPNSGYPSPADRAALVKKTREQAFPDSAPVLQYPLIPLYVALSIWGIYLTPTRLKAEIVYPLIAKLGEMKAFAENA